MTNVLGQPTVFLDRDGTLNVEKDYLYRFEDWEWIDGSLEALRILRENGFITIVVSNQAGIARGKFSAHDVDLLHSKVMLDLADKGAVIDDFYYCPYHPDFNNEQQCLSRKPNPGMLTKAVEKWNDDLSRSWMIGDKLIDVDAGKAAGVNTVLVLTGYGAREIKHASSQQCVATNLLDAVNEFVLPRNY